MSEKHEKVCRVLNYFEHFLVFVSSVSDFILVSVFPSLIGVSLGIASLAAEIKICIISAEFKKYKAIIKKTIKSMMK